jgi:hypothetical protein
MIRECNQFRDLIADLVSGTLAAEQAKQLDEHLDQCADCRAYAEALKREDQLLARLADGVKAAMPDRRADLLQVLSRRRFVEAQCSMWRTIMKSRTTKLASAAVIVAAIIISLSQFKQPVVKAVDFSEVAKAMEQVPWMRETGQNETGVVEIWVGFESKIHAMKYGRGNVNFIDVKGSKLSHYDSENNTITVTRMDSYPFDLTSPATLLAGTFKMLEEQGARITARMGSYEGRRVQVQDVVQSNVDGNGGTYTMTLYIDPDSKRLYGIDMKETDATGSVFKAQSATHDYPQSGPQTIYDLGVPRDARIVDNTASPAQ